MTVVIVGAGAIGSLFATLLSRGPKTIVLLDHDPQRAKLVEKQGIRVTGATEERVYRIRCTADYRCLSEAEYVILAVKAYDTQSVAQSISHEFDSHLAKGIVTIQNGLGNIEILRGFFPPTHLFVGATYHAATFVEPGRVIHTGEGPTFLAGVSHEARGRLPELEGMLRAAGLDARSTDDFASLLWSKVIVNCAINPVTALTRLRNGDAAGKPGLFKIMSESALEAFRVALAVGISPDFEDPVALVLEVAKRTFNNKSSMLQDIENRRRTEADFINGAVVSIAKQRGVSVPVNETLYLLMKGLEDGVIRD